MLPYIFYHRLNKLIVTSFKYCMSFFIFHLVVNLTSICKCSLCLPLMFTSAPGGVVSDDGAENGPVRTSVCVFGAPDASIETLRPYAQLFVRLMRRYKYLEKMFVEEIKKVSTRVFSSLSHWPENNFKFLCGKEYSM